MNNVEIYAFSTHYEIYNYKLGMFPKLERLLSTWDDVNFKRNEYFYYDNEKHILYVPRGLNELMIEQCTDGCLVLGDREPNQSQKMYFKMKYQPRDTVQKEAIRFLLGRNEYNYTSRSSQLILALIGGGGKTYCSTAAMSILGVKTMVICHTSDLINQWVDRLLEYTDLKESNIVKLSSSSDLMKYIDQSPSIRRRQRNECVYIMSHALIHNFIMKEGFDLTDELFRTLGIGLKIVDEFHRNFSNTLLIDYATNVKRTFYLSATPGRTDKSEDKVFQDSFASAYKFRREASDFGRKATTVVIYDLFTTRPIQIDLTRMFVAKKFSVYRYIDYELNNGKILDRIEFWLDWLYNGKVTNGTIYIVSPTKESCEIIRKMVQRLYPEKKCCAHFSGNKVDNIDDYDIVCGTVKMLGTGTDISNLRAMIVAEPVGSAVNADQLIHRLMRGKSNEMTYNIDLVDRAIPNVYNMYNRRKKIYAQFVKQNIVFKSYETDKVVY